MGNCNLFLLYSYNNYNQTHTAMAKKIYVATVKIAVIAENPHEACDAMSGALTENLILSGGILDWRYDELGEPEKIFTDKGEMPQNYTEDSAFE
jgi:hypothetical protein